VGVCVCVCVCVCGCMCVYVYVCVCPSSLPSKIQLGGLEKILIKMAFPKL